GKRGRSQYAPSHIGGSDGQRDDAALFDLMDALGRQLVFLCQTCALKTAAVALAMLREIADTGPEGREWAEGLLIDVAPVLLDRVSDEGDRASRGDAWDYASLLAAYGDLARRDDDARQLVEALAPRVNRGLQHEDFTLHSSNRKVHPDRTLAGCLFALSNLPHATVEAYRCFELIQPLIEQLLDLD